MLCKVFLFYEFVDEILRCEHSNNERIKAFEQQFPVVLFCLFLPSGYENFFLKN